MSRARLIIDAARVAPGVDVQDDESAESVRRRVMTAVMGEQWRDGKPDEYVEGLFQFCVEEGKTAPPAPLLTAGRPRHH